MVGDARSVFLPDLNAFRRGHTRLCGLRLVHTHLNDEPLDDDDLTDLALLRLDLIAAIQVGNNGLPGKLLAAHLLPDNEQERMWEILPPVSVHEQTNDVDQMIMALEDELSRRQSAARTGPTQNRAVLAHVSTKKAPDAHDSMLELKELARSAGLSAVHEVIQRRPIDPRYVMGKGRLRQTVIKAMQLGAEILVFDLSLTPSQLQALSTFTDMKILDRTQVILDIFAQHAATREGKIQVELAQLRYLLPRLGAKQTASAFSRLTGGIGGRGPGETKLEIDRRRAQDRIAMLEREVGKLGKRRKLRRAARTRNNVPIVSIVGYTNAGKSTLLNNLTASHVDAQDALFATLNPVSRRLRFPKEREVVMTDTVGFIRDLPAELMAAFRTTLEEMHEADLLLHVLDASSEEVEQRHETVTKLLSELELNDKPILLALNKADRCDPDVLRGLAKRYDGIPLCALKRSSFAPLLSAMEECLWESRNPVEWSAS